MRLSPRALFVALALSVSWLLLSCGGVEGDGSPTPPVDTGQTVLVLVTTTGEDLDSDGYTVRLGSLSANVDPNGTATFEDISAGTYQVSLEGVADNCTVQGDVIRSVSVTATRGAQASFTVTCATDFGDGFSTVACTSLTLAANSGIPLDRIPAGSVPTTLVPPLGARVIADDGGVIGFAWMEADEAGNLEMVTPLHPSGAMDGGRVLIRVTDGNAACEPFEFTIDPLPASPGEVSTVVDQLRDILRAQAAILETTPEELKTTSLENLEEVLLPIAFVQFVLDHPENDYSLRAIANGTAPTAFPLDRIDALLGRVDIQGALQDQLGRAVRATPRPYSTIDPASCTQEGIGTNTQRLSDCMGALRDLAELIDGFVAGVVPRLSAAILLEESIPQADGAARSVLAGLGWVAIQQELRTFSLLPCCLTGEAPEADPYRFMEDDPETGEWTAPLSAENAGWDLALFWLEEKLIAAAEAGLQNAGFDGAEVRSRVPQLLEGLVADFLPELEIEIRTFGPVLIDDPQWSDVEYAGFPLSSPPTVEKVTHTTYRPVATGRTWVEVISPPEDSPELFGEHSAFSRSSVIEVDSIIIRVEPEDTVLEPEEVMTFRVTVENSKFPHQISGGAVQGTVSQTFEQTGDNTFNLRYQAPSNPNFDSPDIVGVLHEAQTGARMNGPERRKDAKVRFGKVEIMPQPLCVSLNQDFTAEVMGPEDETVTWSTDVGTIDEDGRYEAPPEPPGGSRATVRATSNAYPDMFDEVTFGVGCKCNYALNIGGQMVTSQPGDRMTFVSSGDRLTSVSVVRPSESWEVLLRPDGSDPSAWPSGPGTWPVRVQGDMGLTNPSDILWASNDEVAPLLHLDRYVPRESISGWMEGVTVKIISGVDPRPALFSWWFAVEYQPGEFQCTVPGPG